MPDNSIDLIVTDPPYAVGVSSNGSRSTFNDNNLVVPFFRELLKEYDRVLKDKTEVYMFTDWRTYPLLYPIFYDVFQVKNLIVWDYEWMKTGTHYRFSHELMIYAIKGNHKRLFGGSERDVWRMPPINYTSKDKLHQAQKPVDLLKRIIKNSTIEGAVVLDTFMGSGTTAVACLETGRQFVGFEIDEKYFKIAQERIAPYTIGQ